VAVAEQCRAVEANSRLAEVNNKVDLVSNEVVLLKSRSDMAIKAATTSTETRALATWAIEALKVDLECKLHPHVAV
jgi:hypothetical protein|tara:strand:- start:491 stop:718 length:228 start_codon:yes stop_codon:yes gene_type:complete